MRLSSGMTSLGASMRGYAGAWRDRVRPTTFGGFRAVVGGGSYFLNSTLPSQRIASTPRATEKLTKTPHIYYDLDPPFLYVWYGRLSESLDVSTTKGPYA